MLVQSYFFPTERFRIPRIPEDYIYRENSRQIAMINYLFSVNFHGSIFSLFRYMSWKCMYWNIYVKAKEIND